MADKKVDLEWKKQAKKDLEKMAEETSQPHSHAHDMTPSIGMIISSFMAQALIGLGEIESPIDGQRRLDLEGAKFSIDMLQVLVDKTKGNLTPDEEKMLQGALYDLRMRYVERSQ